MTLSKWQSLGLERANGKAFRNGGDKAVLKIPDGRGGPAFLMLKNLSVIKRYNNADKYALAVGLVADEIAGSNGLVRDWKRPFTKLTFAEKQELQQRLSENGYYDGKADGKADGDVWGFRCLSDRTTNASLLGIFGAQDMKAGPLAVIEIPQRVPFGFHGLWVDESDL